MRAVEGSLGHSLNRDMVNQKALARANGTSRRASGWAGEKVARDQRASLLALQGRREDENMRWVPGNDGMELAAAALAAHDIADDKGLLIDRLFTRPVDCFLCNHD